MTRVALTEMQQRLYVYVAARLAEGCAPSFAEMQAHLGQRSKSGICRLLDGIVERGWLVRLPHRTRAIALPETAQAEALRTISLGEELKRLAGDATTMQVGLKAALASELLAHCERARRIPSDVVAQAITEHLRSRS